eukprot:scaffold83016_cov63-Phaeocystis_antarctica.AAC.1
MQRERRNNNVTALCSRTPPRHHITKACPAATHSPAGRPLLLMITPFTTARACTRHSHSRTSQSGPAGVEVGLETAETIRVMTSPASRP